MKTKLTELLGIKHPIIQGPMAYISDSKLAAAVSEAGGAGVIAAGGRSADWLRNEIRAAKKATNKPFGVNIPLLFGNSQELFDVIMKEKVPFVTLSAGNPVPYLKKLKEAGIIALCVVPNLRLAKRIEEHEADALILEGTEAGGHIGTVTTMALLTQIIPEVKIPVIAAGGIADGRGMAAALVMGAAGVQVGTAFILAEECPVHPNVKQKILEAKDTDSVVTGFLAGHAVRGIRNSFTDKYLKLERGGAPVEELDKLAIGTNYKAAIEGDTENGMVQAGQSLAVLREIRPARVIVEEMSKEAEEILLKAPSLIG